MANLDASSADRAFIDRMTSAPTATASVNRLLARRARDGDVTAYAQMVARNGRLVLTTVERNFSGRARPGFEFNDMVQEGLIGLDRAARHYDPDHGETFATYATTVITRSLRDAAAKQADLIRRPTLVLNSHRAMMAASYAIADREGRPATVAEIAEAANADEASVLQWLEFPTIEYLDAPEFEDGPDRHEGIADMRGVLETPGTQMTEEDLFILEARNPGTNKNRVIAYAVLAEQLGVSVFEVKRRERAALVRSTIPAAASRPATADDAVLMSIRPADWVLLEKHYIEGVGIDELRRVVDSGRERVSPLMTGPLEEWSAWNPGASVVDARARATELWKNQAHVLDGLAPATRELAELTWVQGLDRMDVCSRLGLSPREAIAIEGESVGMIFRLISSTAGEAEVTTTTAADVAEIDVAGELALLHLRAEEVAVYAALARDPQLTFGAASARFNIAPPTIKKRFAAGEAGFDDWRSRIADSEDASVDAFEAQFAAARTNVEAAMTFVDPQQAEVFRLSVLEGASAHAVATLCHADRKSVPGLRDEATRAVAGAMAIQRELGDAARFEFDRDTLGIRETDWQLYWQTSAQPGRERPGRGAIADELGLTPSQGRTAFERAEKVVDEWLSRNPESTLVEFERRRAASRRTLETLSPVLTEHEELVTRRIELEGDTVSQLKKDSGSGYTYWHRRIADALEKVERICAARAEAVKQSQANAREVGKGMSR